MSSPVFTVLLIGCGRIIGSKNSGKHDTHLKGLSQCKNLKVTACVDTDFKKACILASELCCKSYNDLNEALENNYFDIVVVATPDDQHFDQIRQLILSANRPRVIFAEKPVCLDSLQLRELNELTAAYDVQLLINHSRRINPNYSKLKSKISSKFIGNIIFVNAYYYNGWIHNGVHIVDTVLYLFEEAIEWDRCLYAHPSDYKGDISLHASGKLTVSRAPLNIFAFEEKNFQLLEFDLIFSRGRIRLHDFGNQCSIETRTLSASGEKVLVEKKTSPFSRDTASPLTCAYMAISDYLLTKNPEKVRFFSFDVANETMECLFHARNKLEDE